jgi:hypothetical protein
MDDLTPGMSFTAHINLGKPATADRRNCSYGFSDTRGIRTGNDVAMAADAPNVCATVSGSGLSANSDNHFSEGQNVLMYGSDTVIWVTTARNPMLDSDDIYATTNPSEPGLTDSFIHQSKFG